MTLVQLVLMLATVTSASVTTTGTGQNLNWKTHYGNAKRVAQAAKRPLIVVIENSGDSADMNETTLDGESRKRLANKDFELVKVDAKTEYGQRVAKAFGAQKFPYTAVTDDVSERIVFRKSGPMTQADWTIALAKSLDTKAIPAVAAQPTVTTTERVVVQKAVATTQPVVTTNEIPLSQPTNYQQPVVISPTGYVQPQPVFQPMVTPQTFAPNGMYQLPASQCLT